jgi:glycosyltransferase involved in cell wall biosynthesis
MPYTNSTNLTTPQNPTRSTKPMRILHVVGGMDRGGAETWLMHILRNIDRDRFQMDFLAPEDRHYAYTDELQALGSKIFACDLQPSKPWRYATNFKRILSEHGPYDAIHVHVHHFSGYVLRLAREAGIKTRIIHSHIDTSSIESNANWKRKLYTTLMTSWIAKNSTVGLATSRMAAADLLGSAWTSDPRWRTLYCGIDLAPFHNPVVSADVRAEFGIPADTFVVGHIGRFEPQKNHHFLLEIAAQMAQREPNMRLLLIGTGSLLPEIQAKVTQMGLAEQVIFGGVRNDIPRLMKGLMDVFLFPSLYEGLGLVLVEAQAAGLPCILADIVPEEADVVPPLIQRIPLTKSAAYWADAVLAKRNKPRPIDQSAALASVLQSAFNIEVSVKELTAFYNSTIEPSKSISK